MKQCHTELYLERISIGLSHDINNVFTYILGMAELGKLQEQGALPHSDCFDKIISYVDRGRNLTQHVMDFGNCFHCEKEKFSFSEFLNKSKEKFEQNLPNGNKISLNVSGDIDAVCADRVLLSKLFYYLFENAIESYAHTEQESTPVHCAVHRINPTELECAIKDEGIGISPDKEADLFTPFFTTKKAIQHAGMGLTIAQQVVLAHGGEIDIHNNVNNIGVTVKFKLPILLD